jgi:alkyl sulfatase BDS1-like metallo-beta-lactamase superfamily hydrolase
MPPWLWSNPFRRRAPGSRLGSPSDPVIRATDGRVVWDADAYRFLDARPGRRHRERRAARDRRPPGGRDDDGGAGRLAVDGDQSTVGELPRMLDPHDPGFAIVTP